MCGLTLLCHRIKKFDFIIKTNNNLYPNKRIWYSNLFYDYKYGRKTLSVKPKGIDLFLPLCE